jgi:hypothetical protein
VGRVVSWCCGGSETLKLVVVGAGGGMVVGDEKCWLVGFGEK